MTYVFLFLVADLYFWVDDLHLFQRKPHLFVHTYIIGHYKPSVRIIDLVSHTTYVVCVNLYTFVWRDLLFKVDSEGQIFFFEKLFMANFVYSQSFCQISAERKSPKKYFSYFVLFVSPGTRIPTFRLITY